MRAPRHAAWPRRLVAGTSLLAMGVGALTLVGWAFDLPRLTDVQGVGISMFPNPAACTVASGLALLMRGLTDRRWRAVAEWLGAAVAALAGMTLVEHLTGMDFGIDGVLVARDWGQSAAASPLRMGLPASTAFLLTGIALVLLDRGARARSAAATCGGAVMAISMLSLVGYLYGARQMYTIPWLTGIAVVPEQAEQAKHRRTSDKGVLGSPSRTAAQPLCGSYLHVLGGILRHLGVERSAIDTVEFLKFQVAPRIDDAGSVADDPAPKSHDVVRFLRGGKPLASGMFFEAMSMILFWPCGPGTPG